jgi:sulfur carrier protein ThiS adenylyltransferase
MALQNPSAVNASTTSFAPDRAIRQRDLVPPTRLAECHAIVIGVGAIGRQVSLQLAALGISYLTLYDHDRVAVENLAPQGYRPCDISNFKVDCTAEECRRILPDLHVIPKAERFRRSTAREIDSGVSSLVVFCCVDSIGTRKLIWEAIRGHAGFFVDGRMSAEVMRILAVDSPLTDAYYPTTLFAAEEAFAGACTSKSTIYTASIAAGLMLGQFTKWLRGMPVDRDLSLNLLSSELTVAA